MNALFTPRRAIEKTLQLLAFLPLAFMIYPEASLAAQSGILVDEQNKPLVFQVQNPNLFQNQTLSYDQVVQQDPLIAKCQDYLAKKGSPLAEYCPEIIKQPQWQRALAISFVESNFGKFCFTNNCSGIGGAPGMPTWRKYETKLDWFVDLNELLEKPIYKEKYVTFQQMKGVYVQPGSAKWVNGATKVYNELMALTEQADMERKQIAMNHGPQVLGAATESIEKANFK